MRLGGDYGPHDSSDTVLYWVRRGARGGRVVVPTSPEQPIQLTDVRDLGRLVMRLIVDDRAGAFNAVGPESTIGEVITLAAEIAGVPAELVQVPADVVPVPLPLMMPEEEWPSRQRNPAKARAAGMPVTPLRQTIADMLAWDRDRGEPPIESGLTPEQEEKLLASR